MKSNYKRLAVSVVLLVGASILALSQQMEVLGAIPISPSMSLLIKRTTLPTAGSNVITLQTPGESPLEVRSIDEAYIVSLKSRNSEVDLDTAKFKSAAGAEDSVEPRFAVYDAVLDGNTLRYFFVNKGHALLATAHVDESGTASDYRQRPLPEAFSRIDTAHFIKDKNGLVTLKVREAGKKTKAFQFNSSGQTVRVSAEQDSSTSSK